MVCTVACSVGGVLYLLYNGVAAEYRTHQAIEGVVIVEELSGGMGGGVKQGPLFV